MSTPLDDRGSPCAVARLTNRQLAWRALGIKSLTKDDLVKREQQITINLEIVIALAGGVLGWVLWTSVFLPFTSLNGTLIGTLGIPMMSSIVVSTVIWFLMLGWVRKHKFSKIAQIHLDHACCAACGYSLRDLHPEADGCFVCPECNAAWLASRVRTSTETKLDD
jgi:hypothetical protein